MLNPEIQNKIPEVVKILKSHRVKRAYAFGSVCTEEFNKDSDVDLIVAFDIHEPFDGYAENFWSMEDELMKVLKRKVDLVPEHTLKNPYFISEMEKTKTILYE